MFDANDDVYFYIGFATVSLYVFYPLPSNIMHTTLIKLTKIPNKILLKYIKYINKINEVHELY